MAPKQQAPTPWWMQQQAKRLEEKRAAALQCQKQRSEDEERHRSEPTASTTRWNQRWQSWWQDLSWWQDTIWLTAAWEEPATREVLPALPPQLSRQDVLDVVIHDTLMKHDRYHCARKHRQQRKRLAGGWCHCCLNINTSWNSIKKSPETHFTDFCVALLCNPQSNHH